MGYKLIFNGDTDQFQYTELFTKPVGYIFKIETDYETVMQRIKDYTPVGVTFEVFPINPGTEQFALVGPGHVIVTQNSMIH